MAFLFMLPSSPFNPLRVGHSVGHIDNCQYYKNRRHFLLEFDIELYKLNFSSETIQKIVKICKKIKKNGVYEYGGKLSKGSYYNFYKTQLPQQGFDVEEIDKNFLGVKYKVLKITHPKRTL